MKTIPLADVFTTSRPLRCGDWFEWNEKRWVLFQSFGMPFRVSLVNTLNWREFKCIDVRPASVIVSNPDAIEMQEAEEVSSVPRREGSLVWHSPDGTRLGTIAEIYGEPTHRVRIGSRLRNSGEHRWIGVTRENSLCVFGMSGWGRVNYSVGALVSHADSIDRDTLTKVLGTLDGWELVIE